MPTGTPRTATPPKVHAPSPSEEPTTVTTPPPEERPTEGSTLSAKPASAYSNETPLALYAPAQATAPTPAPAPTSTGTRPEECEGLAHWRDPPGQEEPEEKGEDEDARAATGATLPKAHDQPDAAREPPSYSTRTNEPPDNAPRDGRNPRTPTAPTRPKDTPPPTKDASGPTTPTDKGRSPRAEGGASTRASELLTTSPEEDADDSPKRNQAPAPTKPRPDTAKTLPAGPDEGHTAPTDGDETYR